MKDFSPIFDLISTPQTLVTSATGPYKSLKDFLQAARTTSQAIDYASIGLGSTSHMAGQYLQSAAKLSLNHVPFKGNADAQTQVIGGLVPVRPSGADLLRKVGVWAPDPAVQLLILSSNAKRLYWAS